MANGHAILVMNLLPCENVTADDLQFVESTHLDKNKRVAMQKKFKFLLCLHKASKRAFQWPSNFLHAVPLLSIFPKCVY